MTSSFDQITELERGMAVLEAQRGVLGDAVVEAALVCDFKAFRTDP